MADPKFFRGARPSPAHKVLAAPRFVPVVVPLGQKVYVPSQLDMWGNDQYGDCVTAEEAFNDAALQPEQFVPAATVIDWARKHGVLNGASLDEVLDAFQSDGFKVGNQRLNDGKYHSVDYANEAVLQAALDLGPVKIAIDANALPNDAGNKMGWHAFGKGRYPNTDHCVSICGYGPTAWLAEKVGATLTGNVPQNGYLIYTWKTIGIVDHDWLMGTCVEAWLRQPNVVGIPPLPSPEPTPPPTPPPGPTPVPPPGPTPIPPPIPPGPEEAWTVHVPAVDILIHHHAGAQAPPPWLLLLLTILCGSAPTMPPPWNAILAALCPKVVPPAH